MEKYDLIVIGGGPSGYAAAMRGVDFNKKVLLVEKDRIGGAGIYNGALTSKTFWELSRQALAYHENLKTFNVTAPDVPFKRIKDSVDQAAKERNNILEEQITWLRNLNNSAFTSIKGTASLQTKNEVSILTDEEEFVVWGENIVLATGSRPRYIKDI
ncbi:MAG: FAD-dependent oxidoreductase, partial [Cytophagales bacterium]